MHRRRAVRDDLRQWLRDLERSEGIFGEPEEWSFDNPVPLVKTGYWLWKLSGLQRLPTRQEVLSYEDSWITDMQLINTLYEFQNNKTLKKLESSLEGLNGKSDG